MRDATIEFRDGSVDPQTTREQFLASHPDAERVIENGPRRSYQIRSSIRGFEVGAILYFNEAALDRISLCTWEDLDDSDAKSAHDRWLAEEFGIDQPDTEFSWGRVESVLDPKGGGAVIVVSYKRNE